MVKAEVDGIILTVVTESDDPDAETIDAADAALRKAEEFLVEWIRIYKEMREMRDG